MPSVSEAYRANALFGPSRRSGGATATWGTPGARRVQAELTRGVDLRSAPEVEVFGPRGKDARNAPVQTAEP